MHLAERPRRVEVNGIPLDCILCLAECLLLSFLLSQRPHGMQGNQIVMLLMNCNMKTLNIQCMLCYVMILCNRNWLKNRSYIQTLPTGTELFVNFNISSCNNVYTISVLPAGFMNNFLSFCQKIISMSLLCCTLHIIKATSTSMV